MSYYPLIAATVFSIGVAISSAQGMENVIPRNQPPLLQVFPPSAAEQSKAGSGKFVVFTREPVGTNWDFIAGAWECIPAHPEIPVTKRAEFCHSSWNGDQLLNTLVMDDSYGMHPRFIRLQVDSGDREYAVYLYDINYRTWEVRCIWQGSQLTAVGIIGDSIFCNSTNGWLRLDAISGKFSKDVPLIPMEADGSYWLVRKAGETNGGWSYDRVKQQFITHFESVDQPAVGYSQSLLSPDGQSRAWVLAPMPAGWHGGAIQGKLILQRGDGKEAIAVAITMQAVMGSGVPVIPRAIQLQFSPEGRLHFRAWQGDKEAEDRLWSIDIATGQVSSNVVRHLPPADDASAVLDGVPVPDYLRKHVSGLKHFGRSGLAPAFLLYLGILKEQPDYPDCTVGVSRDGRHVLYRAKKGPLSKVYIYGDLLTKQTVCWESPDGLNCSDSQVFVWVETPD